MLSELSVYGLAGKLKVHRNGLQIEPQPHI